MEQRFDVEALKEEVRVFFDLSMSLTGFSVDCVLLDMYWCFLLLLRVGM